MKEDKVGFIDFEGVLQIDYQYEVGYEGEVSIGFNEGICAVATKEGWIYQ